MDVVRPVRLNNRGLLETINTLITDRLSGVTTWIVNTYRAGRLTVAGNLQCDDIRSNGVPIATMLSTAAATPVYLYIFSQPGAVVNRGATNLSSKACHTPGYDPDPTLDARRIVASSAASTAGETAYNVIASGWGALPDIRLTGNPITIPSDGTYRIYFRLAGASGTGTLGGIVAYVTVGGVMKCHTYCSVTDPVSSGMPLLLRNDFLCTCTAGQEVAIGFQGGNYGSPATDISISLSIIEITLTRLGTDV